MQIVERLRERFATKTRTAMDAYAELLAMIGTGTEPDEDSVIEILEAAGKSPADLEQDIAKGERRNELQETVDHGNAAIDEMRQTNLAIEAEAGLLRTAQTRWERVGGGLQEKQSVLQSIIQRGAAAERELCDAAVRIRKRAIN